MKWHIKMNLSPVKVQLIAFNNCSWVSLHSVQVFLLSTLFKSILKCTNDSRAMRSATFIKKVNLYFILTLNPETPIIFTCLMKYISELYLKLISSFNGQHRVDLTKALHLEKELNTQIRYRLRPGATNRCDKPFLGMQKQIYVMESQTQCIWTCESVQRFL